MPECKENRSPQEIFSDAHKGRPCTSCVLCKENSLQYTHPVKWKDASLGKFLQSIQPDLNVPLDACICRKCRDNLSAGQKNPDNYHPRWATGHAQAIVSTCEVSGCIEAACRQTKLASREEIQKYLQCPPLANLPNDKTSLCDMHYRLLHKRMNPASYQLKCAVCSIAIRGSNYRNFRACAEPQLFQQHLIEHTDLEGQLTASDKVCFECYKHSLTVVRVAKEKAIIISSNSDFYSLVDSIRDSIATPLPAHATDENKIIECALKMSAVDIGILLLNNRALTLISAYDIFQEKIQSLDTSCPEPVRTPRWLLGQLSLLLKHHLAYTCRVKKHGTMLYRQGRELDCLSHSLFALKNYENKTDHVAVCTDLNKRLRAQAAKAKLSTNLLDTEKQIQLTDPVLWDVVCILTQTNRDKANTESSPKNIRRLFILHQLMYCLDNTCSMPFHMVIADLLDCHGGSSELIKVFNRLGICVSIDTLQRHIQGTIQHLTSHGLLQGMNYNFLTVFTVDNVDFMHSYAQVFNGNQQLSWHGTTL